MNMKIKNKVVLMPSTFSGPQIRVIGRYVALSPSPSDSYSGLSLADKRRQAKTSHYICLKVKIAYLLYKI